MKGKDTTKKAWNKIIFGILFVISCFIAMYVLIKFNGNPVYVGVAAALLLISAFLFLNAIFSDKVKSMIPEEEEELEISDNGDFRLKVAKHMKEMESTQKELIDVLKNQNTLIQTRIENLAHEIYLLSEKQVNQAKSIIKYNKENARQLAISERETLEYVMIELKKAIEENGGPARAGETPAAEVPDMVEDFVSAPVLEDVSADELFAVSELAADEEYAAPEFPVPEPAAEPVVEEAPVETQEFEIPEMPDDLDLAALFDIPELNEEPEAPAVEEAPAAEEPAAEEPAPAADPLAGLSADPNAMMTPEDIAKLLEAMGQ